MSDKDLKVLAECVDIRSGRRFFPGETFDPAPTETQARRLVLAGVLPEGAIEVAKKADAENEKKADADAKEREAAAVKQSAIAKATDELSAANLAVREAEAKLAKATSTEDKSTAQKALDDAKAKAKEAKAALDQANK